MLENQLNLLNAKIFGLIKQVMVINQDLDSYYEIKLVDKKKSIQNNLDILISQRLTIELTIGTYGSY